MIPMILGAQGTTRAAAEEETAADAGGAQALYSERNPIGRPFHLQVRSWY